MITKDLVLLYLKDFDSNITDVEYVLSGVENEPFVSYIRDGKYESVQIDIMDYITFIFNLLNKSK